MTAATLSVLTEDQEEINLGLYRRALPNTSGRNSRI